jgi:hypothetical protein
MTRGGVAGCVAIAISSVLVGACGRPAPPAPGDGDVITGGERFGWDQPAVNGAELAAFRYAMYVDDVRSEAADVSCAAGQVNGVFACTSRIPAMAAGTHTLQIAAFVSDGVSVLESSRSAPLRVTRR